eukprot:gene18904-24706_t
MSPLQLSVRGKPSAFDLSLSNDICVIASPGCLSFFHLNGYGSPKQVIHYEQPQQIRQLKYQRGGNQLLAAIRGGGLSLWDPNKPLRPLQGVCRGNGWITDMDWCYNNTNCLVTSSDNGGPKDGYNLEKIYQPPNTDEINDGPFTHIATLQNSNILGIRFGTPGRLIPPSHS